MLDIKRIRTDFDAVAEKLATRGVDAAVLNEMKEIDAKRVTSWSRLKLSKQNETQFLLRLPKLSATRKMQITRLLPCKIYLLRSRHWMLNWQKSMLN